MLGSDVLLSGKAPFRMEVPYQVIESGVKGDKKPLIIYLHGYGENLKISRNVFSECLDISALHLFIEGPYPIFKKQKGKKVEDWGRSWYLYDGRDQQFIKSMEIVSEFIQGIIDKLSKILTFKRVCIIGYSMGGYLAGYFALTRVRYVQELIAIGCRIKTEILEPRQTDWENFKNLKVHAIHGKSDSIVDAAPQIKEIEFLKSKNINASHCLTSGSHKIDNAVLYEIKQWLKSNGYTT